MDILMILAILGREKQSQTKPISSIFSFEFTKGQRKLMEAV